MSKNVLIVDGNSLGHWANNGARLSLGDFEVQAIYGFLRAFRQHIANHQLYSPIVVWDGASWRRMLLSSYKENRDRAETKNEIKLLKAKEGYKKQAPYIEKALRFLGIPQVRALNMEADDLGAILCDRYVGAGSKVVLLTGDKDWLQLVGPGVTWRDFANGRLVGESKFEEMTGVKTPREFVEVKALSGDTGDNVPGVGGIGKKGAIEFVRQYGSFANFTNQVIFEKTIDLASLPKKYRALVEDEEKAIAFQRNINLVDLRTAARPAPINLVIDKGEPSLEKFQQFCELLLFKSITQELTEWIRVFPAFRDAALLGESLAA